METLPLVWEMVGCHTTSSEDTPTHLEMGWWPVSPPHAHLKTDMVVVVVEVPASLFRGKGCAARTPCAHLESRWGSSGCG